MGRAAVTLAIGLAALAAPGAALGQGLVPSAQVTRVEPGVGDAGPVSIGLRVMPLDLRVATGFDTVYRVDRKDRYGGTQTLYARSDGGLTAVFPRSEYVETGGGLLAQVPAGTIWVIGGLHEDRPVRARTRAFNALDLSVGNEPDPPPRRQPPVPRAHERAEAPTIWTSEPYRRERVATLLRALTGGEP